MPGRCAGSAGSCDATGSRDTALAASAPFSTYAAAPATRSSSGAAATRSTTVAARAPSTAAGRSTVARRSTAAGGPAAAPGALTTLPATAVAASPSRAAPVATGAGSTRAPVTRAGHRPARTREPDCQSQQRQMNVSPHDHLMQQPTDHSSSCATLRYCWISFRFPSES